MIPIDFPPRPAAWTEMNICGCLDYYNDGPILFDVIKVTQPKNILEVGFFAGSSSFQFLTFSNAKLTSVDPMKNLYDPNVKHDGKIENVQKLKDHFGADRFTFIQKDSRVIRPDIQGQKFDLMFIDGDHWDSGIRNDFQIALDMDIPWVLADDFVTNVENIYWSEFADKFELVRLYPRKDKFMGKPIPIALFKRI